MDGCVLHLYGWMLYAQASRSITAAGLAAAEPLALGLMHIGDHLNSAFGHLELRRILKSKVRIMISEFRIQNSEFILLNSKF